MAAGCTLTLMTSVGEQWVAAIEARDRTSLTALLADDVDFRGLTPRRAWEATTPEAVADVAFRLVPLTANPGLLANGTFTYDGSRQGTAAVSAVAPGGRLRNLLDALPHADAVTALIDPTVVQTLAIAGTGSYQVTKDTGAAATKYAKSADALQWLADLRGADRVSLIATPYANPDVQAAYLGGPAIPAPTAPVQDEARKVAVGAGA